MGDTARDPVDHVRTTRMHAGETMKNTRALPGILLGALAVFAMAFCLFLFADGHVVDGVASAFVTMAIGTGSVLWILGEHHRVMRVERAWLAQHPGIPWEDPPTS